MHIYVLVPLISLGFLHIDEKCRGFKLMHIALIQDLLKGPLPPGSTLLVEYDPTSTWYQASLCIAAEWLMQRDAWYQVDVSHVFSTRSVDPGGNGPLTNLG